jgi:hypothetical protein
MQLMVKQPQGLFDLLSIVLQFLDSAIFLIH